MEKLFEGQKIGRWTLLNKLDNGRWMCECECGTIRDVSSDSLSRGGTNSCGCLAVDINRKLHTTHGKYYTKLHSVWCGMLQRCYYNKHIDYKWYMENNITVCDEWRNDFMNFYNWAYDNGYKEGLSIDRIDNNLGYCPENCRFATPKEQANNRSTNINIEYCGETKTLKQWAEHFDIKYSRLYYRVRTRGMSLAQAIIQ